jgi:hypothetical protein
VAVIAFANHGLGECIQNSRALAAGAFVEVARILFQDGRQDSAADVGANDKVAVSRPVALCVALRTLPIAAEIVLCLFNSRDDAIHCKTDRIDGGFPGQLKFLSGGKRGCVGDIADIEVRKHPKNALLFFDLDFVLRHIYGRGRYAHLS